MKLPRELIDHIFEYLPESKLGPKEVDAYYNALAPLAVVCRSWVDPARRALYGRLFVSDKQRWYFLVHRLRESIHLRSLVRELVFICPSSLFYPLDPIFPQLESIIIEKGPHTLELAAGLAEMAPSTLRNLVVSIDRSSQIASLKKVLNISDMWQRVVLSVHNRLLIDDTAGAFYFGGFTEFDANFGHPAIRRLDLTMFMSGNSEPVAAVPSVVLMLHATRFRDLDTLLLLIKPDYSVPLLDQTFDLHQYIEQQSWLEQYALPTKLVDGHCKIQIIFQGFDRIFIDSLTYLREFFGDPRGNRGIVTVETGGAVLQERT